MDYIGVNGDIIDTKEIFITDFFRRNPDYYYKHYVIEAANEYISMSIKQFIKDSCWQFELYNNNQFVQGICRRFKLHNWHDYGYIDDFSDSRKYNHYKYGLAHELDNPEVWPIPQKDGTWVGKDGKRWYPRIWFGLKDERPNDAMAIDSSDIRSWFNEDLVNFLIKFDNSEQVDLYHGYIPDMKAIRKNCPITVKACDTPESIKEKIQKFFIRQYKIVQQVPAKHILYCDYPGLEFRTEFDASERDYSYEENEYEYYRSELEELIFNELASSQGIEKLMDAHFTEDDVSPYYHFDYMEVMQLMTEVLPYNDKVKIYLDSVNKKGKLIETKEINIKDCFIYDPEIFQEGGMFNATSERISASIKCFVKESYWHFALQNGSEIIENVKQWPSPNKDGSWIKEDGTEMQPIIWFGLKDDFPDDLWTLNDGNDIDFWFNEDDTRYFVEYSYDAFAGSYHGDIPDMKAIREKCPILLEIDDTSDSIKEKTQAFFVEQYRKLKE